MKRKQFSTEQNMAVIERTFYRWKRRYAGLEPSQRGRTLEGRRHCSTGVGWRE